MAKATPSAPPPGQQPKLLDRVRIAISLKSIRTEETYVAWIERYIHFYKLRHLLKTGMLDPHSPVIQLSCKKPASTSEAGFLFTS